MECELCRFSTTSVVQPPSPYCRPHVGFSKSDTSASLEEIGSEEDDEHVLVGETWVDWLIRTASIAEKASEIARIQDWITEQRRRLWRFAGHTARRQDERRNRLLLEWKPQRVQIDLAPHDEVVR